MKKLLALVTICLVCTGATCSTKQTVLISCDAAASGLDAITAAALAKKIPTSSLAKGIEVYEKTAPFCDPPVENMSAVQKAGLGLVIAELTKIAGDAP